MDPLRIALLLFCAAYLSWVGAAGYGQSSTGSSSAQAQTTTKPQDDGKPTAAVVPALPRGKKLVLKDGTFQLTRDYQRTGDRVRYLSAERGDWEEIPAAMVDWDATAKAEAVAKSEDEAIAKKVRAREQAQNIEPVVDVDSSLQVGPGLFLPSGEGMFVFDGKSVRLLDQAGSQVKTDKKQYLKQVLSPIPIVPGKHNVQLPGARAKIRVLAGGRTEFYLREAPPDPDRTTPILKSSRPGESGPEVELVRATVKGDSRRLETISTLFGQEEAARTTISIEKWDVAPTVYRYTLSQDLPPGEYALAEILTDGMNLYVWDFGVDEAAGTKTTATKPKN